MTKGNIGVTSDNIFPVIKKFLYSDHEIFLRELISNAVDATQKLKTLASVGEAKGELGDTRVRVLIDKKKKTLTVQDHGIGMTAEEVDKYINQIAFSGAEEFVNKYKDNAAAIIGHFGLGFYSAFMVADEVHIDTRSWQADAEPVHWECDGGTEFSMTDGDKKEVGTTITLFLNEESVEQVCASGKIYAEVWYDIQVDMPLYYDVVIKTGKNSTNSLWGSSYFSLIFIIVFTFSHKPPFC